METELTTQRLILRQWENKDFESYAAYFAHQNLARFVGGPCSRERAWRRMAALVGHWALRGFGPFAVEEKATGLFVGQVGIWYSEGWPEPELGYWIAAEMQGKGYATEAGAEAVNWAKNHLNTQSLVSFIAPDNDPSKRVAEKLGARYDKTIDLVDCGTHRVYRHW